MASWVVRGLACGALCVGFVGGCDSDDDDLNAPALNIEDPPTGKTVELEADDMTVDIRLNLENFDVDEPAGCDIDDETACGTVVVRIDGDACNRPGTNYNNVLTSESSAIEADFSFCPTAMRLGAHTITVGLLQPNGSPVLDFNGVPLQDSVSITTVPEIDD